ncbi:MAG: c-type cytochrome [Fidelibacterota bacterium]
MKKLIILQLSLFVVVFTGCEDNKATNTYVDDNYSAANMDRGGRLYDKWWSEAQVDEPTGDHPLYPASSAKSGSTTWRCKECHGWDYIGKDGRYSSGSHYTGIDGIAQAKGTDPNDVFDALQDVSGNHDFSAYLEDADLLDLTKFIVDGQADFSNYIDSDGSAIGDPTNGETIFTATCGNSSCHGADGNAIDFHEDEEGEQGLFFLSNDNPQESLHKIFWGQPNSVMPSLIDEGYSEQDCADVLAYIQNLAYYAADMDRGGRLYDKWWAVNGGTEPTDTHALYPASSAKSGSTTWRCKECHGWDYIGKDGRYSSGSHYTGIAGIEAAMTNDIATVYASLTDATGDHDFSGGMSEQDLYDLTKFIREGQFDMYQYIDANGQAIGDTTNGETIFTATCGVSSCHGADGNAIDFHEDEDGDQGLGWLSNDNPQETFHKIHWGQPNSMMPSLIEDSYTHQDCADVLAYIQGL